MKVTAIVVLSPTEERTVQVDQLAYESASHHGVLVGDYLGVGPHEGAHLHQWAVAAHEG